MHRNFSIKHRMLAILIGMLVPVVAFLIYANIHMVRAMDQKIVESGVLALHVYANDVQDTLSEVESRMLVGISQNADFTTVSNPASDEMQVYLASYNILDGYRNLVRQTSELSGCMLYSAAHGFTKAVWADSITGYDRKQNILDQLDSVLSAQDFRAPNSWWVLVCDNHAYLCRVMGYRSTYVAALIDLDNLTEHSETHSILFVQNGAALTDAAAVGKAAVQLDDSGSCYFTGAPQRYLYIREALADSDIEIGYLQRYDGLLSSLSGKDRTIFVISLFSLLLIPAAYLLLQRTFFAPVDKLVAAMNRIKEGGEPDALDSYREIEFEQVNTTFQEMLQQIRRLKIEAYEKQLEAQKVELQYYQIQIKPHFYLNCLKNIYAMLEDGSNAQAQKFILYLSRHLRYMLQDKAVVTLEEELQYVRNYIMIQELSQRYPPRCQIDGDVSMLQMPFPAVSLLPFVENSVKYASGLPKSLSIHITFALLQQDGDTLYHITVKDDGSGFSAEQLDKLNLCEGDGLGGGHIGIRNVIQRFALYYGKENVGFVFSNAAPGAVIEIFLKKKA